MSKEGRIWMLLGLLMMMAALFLTVKNLTEDRNAGRQSETALEQLQDTIGQQADSQAVARLEIIDEDGNVLDIMPEDAAADLGGKKLWLRDRLTGLKMEWTEINGNQIPWEQIVEQWRLYLRAFEESYYNLPDFELNPKMEMPVKKVDGYYYIGTLDIPSQNLSLPVITDWSYSKLRVAPCRYSGSVYSHDIVIAGHNYWRHFSRIKNLNAGDSVIFTDMDGNVFRYNVLNQQVLRRGDTKEMTDAKNWDLTMFTCTFGGSRRAAVRCELVDTVPAG